MAYIVTENCKDSKYTDCVEICPVDAFHEGENMVYINPNFCVDCDLCVTSCPVEAIYAEKDLPEKYRKWVEINARMVETLPVIRQQKSPLPGAKTLDELRESP